MTQGERWLSATGIKQVIALNKIEYIISNEADDFTAIIKKGDAKLILKKNMADSLKNTKSRQLIELYSFQLKTARFIHYIFSEMREKGMITEIPEFADTINIPKTDLT